MSHSTILRKPFKTISKLILNVNQLMMSNTILQLFKSDKFQCNANYSIRQTHYFKTLPLQQMLLLKIAFQNSLFTSLFAEQVECELLHEIHLTKQRDAPQLELFRPKLMPNPISIWRPKFELSVIFTIIIRKLHHGGTS